MKINELMESNRKKELIAICRFICTCDCDELRTIIEEIRCFHDNLLCFNSTTGSLSKVESVCINGECLQLNLEP